MVAGLTTEDRGQRTKDRGVVAAARHGFIKSRHSHTIILSSALCLLSSVLCYAEALPDPTRPATEIGVAAGVAADERAVATESSSLQSVIIYPDRRAAIINGQTVELGEKYGDARLIEVSERGVVLQGKQGRRVLALFPGVQLQTKPRYSLEKNPARKALVHAVPKEKE